MTLDPEDISAIAKAVARELSDIEHSKYAASETLSDLKIKAVMQGKQFDALGYLKQQNKRRRK